MNRRTLEEVGTPYAERYSGGRYTGRLTDQVDRETEMRKATTIEAKEIARYLEARPGCMIGCISVSYTLGAPEPGSTLVPVEAVEALLSSGFRLVEGGLSGPFFARHGMSEVYHRTDPEAFGVLHRAMVDAGLDHLPAADGSDDHHNSNFAGWDR